MNVRQLSDYNGRSLSSFNSSTIVHNPSDVPETAELRAWFDASGGGSSFKSVSVRSGGGGSDGETNGGELDGLWVTSNEREGMMFSREKEALLVLYVVSLPLCLDDGCPSGLTN